MLLKKQILFLLILLNFSDCLAQAEFLFVVNEFNAASNRLLVHDDIRIEWTMVGAVQADLNEGINHLNEKLPSVALSDLSKVIAQDSKLGIAYYYRGVANKQLGQLKEAREDLLTACGLLGEQYECQMELGKISILEKDFVQAEKYFSKCIKLDPNRAVGYFLKGVVLLTRDDLKGRKFIEQSLAKDHDFHDARIKLGIFEILTQQKLEVGLPYFNYILERDSVNEYALFFRTITNSKNDKDQGLHDINSLVRLKPAKTLYRSIRGTILMDHENYELAFNDFHNVLQTNYDDESLFKGQQTWFDKKIDLQFAEFYTVSKVYGFEEQDAAAVKKAFCLMLIQKYDEAIATLTKVKQYDKSSLCLFLLGLTYEHKGAHLVALNFYSRALTYDNEIFDAHKKVGIYHSNLQQWKDAVKHFSAALQLNPNSHTVWKLRGVANYYANDCNSAIKDFNYFLKTDSTDHECLLSRAHCFEKVGDLVAAAEDRIRATEFQVLQYNDFLANVNVVLQKGDTTKALKYMDIFSAKNKSLTMYIHKLRVLLKQDDWARTGREVDAALVCLHETLYSPAQHSFLLLCKALVYAHDNNQAGAEEFFEKSLTIEKDNPLVYLERGKHRIKRGDFKAGATDLTKASKSGNLEAQKILDTLEVKR